MRATPHRRPAAAGRAASREQAQRVWWFFLVIGCLWLVFALLVFRVDATTVEGIAILTGIVCMAGAGLEFLAAAAVHGGWRVVRILLGLAFVVIGTLAFIHPQNTFRALATIFAFYLLLGGLFLVVSSLFERGELWWLRLLAGRRGAARVLGGWGLRAQGVPADRLDRRRRARDRDRPDRAGLRAAWRGEALSARVVTAARAARASRSGA